MEGGQNAPSDVNVAESAKRRIAPIALKADEVVANNLEESVPFQGVSQQSDNGPDHAPFAENEPLDAEDFSEPSSTELQGPVTDEQLQELVDELIDVELENYELQEELEEESLESLRKEVATELAEKYEGDALEVAVDEEMALVKEHKEEDLSEGQARAAVLQEQLEDAGVHLRSVYIKIDEMWSRQARTEAWKNTQWTNEAVPEKVREVVKQVNQYLEASRPVGKDKEGRTLGLGASGYMAQKYKALRKQSRKIEKRRAKAAAKQSKQPLEEQKDEEKLEQEESSSDDEESSSEPETSVSGEAIWAALCSSDEEDNKIAKLAKTQTEKIMLKKLAALYKAETPEEAVRLCETIEGATEVEEIGEAGEQVTIKFDAALLKRAFKEENAKGLTEVQRKTMKKRGEDEDRVKAVRQRKKYTYKEPKPRKPRAPKAKPSVPSEPPSSSHQTKQETPGLPSRSSPEPAATEVLDESRSAAKTSSEKSFETAKEEVRAPSDSVGNFGNQERVNASQQASPDQQTKADEDFPACEAEDTSPVTRAGDWEERADEEVESDAKESDLHDRKASAEENAELPSPSDEARQPKEERKASSSPGSLKRTSTEKGGSPVVKKQRFEVPVGVEFVDLASESEKESDEDAKTPVENVFVHLDDSEEKADTSTAEEKTPLDTEMTGEVKSPIAKRTRSQLRAAMNGWDARTGSADADVDEEMEEPKDDDRTVEEIARDAARKKHLAEGMKKGAESSKEAEKSPKKEIEATSCAASATVVKGVKEEAEISSPVRSPQAKCPDSVETKRRRIKRLSQLATPSFRKGETLESETPSDLEDCTPDNPKRQSLDEDLTFSKKMKGTRRVLLADDQTEESLRTQAGKEETSLQTQAGKKQTNEAMEAESQEKDELSIRGEAKAEANPRTGHVTPEQRDGFVEDYDSDADMEEAAESDDAWDRKKDREIAKREAATKKEESGDKEPKGKKREAATKKEEKEPKGKKEQKCEVKQASSFDSDLKEDDWVVRSVKHKSEPESDDEDKCMVDEPTSSRDKKRARTKSASLEENEESDGFQTADGSLAKRRKSETSSKEKSDVSASGKSGSKQKSVRKKKDKVVRLGCKCTTCKERVKPRKIQTHIVLGVTQCRNCFKHYSAATFPKGDDGWEEECLWCGDGGTLTMCSGCKRTVCKDCIDRNLGDQAWDAIGDDWLCYVCEPEPLSRLQEAHERALAEQSDGEGADRAEKSSKKRKGRKNIKAINDKLDPETEAKLKMERERLERIEQRRAKTAMSPLKAPRKSLGNEIDEDSPEQEEELMHEEEMGDGNSGRSVIINASKPEDEDAIFIDPAIAEKLKPHQVDGVRFMWENVVETVKLCAETPKKGLGCILAHSMGLGKTLQVVTLVHTMLTNKELNIRTVLIVVPVNVLRNWSSEFEKWQGGDEKVRKKVKVYTVEDAGSKNDQRAEMLAKWQRTGGAMIIGYTAFRNAVSGRTIKDKELRESFKQSLRDPGPDVLICDEAHMIKNIKADITKELKAVKTRRRIALTGSPLQNNLLEYYCMVDFVREQLLGSVAAFKNKFQNPISNGQHVDSKPKDIRKMKRQSHVLHKLLQGFVQRKDQRILGDMLPPKSVYVISVRLSPLQRRLYQRLLDALPAKNGNKGKNYLFQAYQALTKVWNHPNLLHLSKEKEDAKAEDIPEDALAGDDEAPPETSPDIPSSRVAASSDFQSASVTEQTARENEKENIEEGAVSSPLKGAKDCTEAAPAPKRGRGRAPGAKTRAPRQPGWEIPSGWWQEEIPEPVDLLEGSGKVALTMDLLKTSTAKGDKMLIFSQSLFTLDVLEMALSELPRGGNASKKGTWLKNREYYRLDGSTPSTQRQRLVERFNDPANTDVKCVLISTRAGSLGINLPAANRVIIVDGSWNPTHDLQAMFRAWRFGQTKPVYVYRLLACGTMEENIYARQVTKESLSARVVDEQQIANHFSNQELDSLFDLAEDDDDFTPEDSTPARSGVNGDAAAAEGACHRENGAVHTESGAVPIKNGAVHTEDVAAAKSGMNEDAAAGHTEAAKEAMRRGVKTFAVPDDMPPKDDVLARVLLRNRPRWIVRYHEHDVLLEDKELEHLDEQEKALAWKEHEEVAIRETRPELSPEQVEIQLLLSELSQTERNAGLSEEERRTKTRRIQEDIARQRRLLQQAEMQRQYQAELLKQSQGHVASAEGGPKPAGAGTVPVFRAPPTQEATQIPAAPKPTVKLDASNPPKAQVDEGKARDRQEHLRRMALYDKIGH